MSYTLLSTWDLVQVQRVAQLWLRLSPPPHGHTTRSQALLALLVPASCFAQQRQTTH